MGVIRCKLWPMCPHRRLLPPEHCIVRDENPTQAECAEDAQDAADRLMRDNDDVRSGR